MRLNRVDLNLFVIFEAIYTERNLTRAAAALSLTQPAVSNALNRLRSMLDDELFVRQPRGMLPTPMADTIIGQVREALSKLNFCLDERLEFDPLQSEKVFRLSMNDLAEFMMLPPLMKVLQARAPNMQVHCYYRGRENLVRELASGQLDLAVDVPLISDPTLCQLPLKAESYVCMVRMDHPAIGERLSLAEYLSLDHLQVSSRRSGGGQVEEALNKLGKRRRVAMRVQHSMMAPQIISQSNLAWTAPRSLAGHFELKVVGLPFKMAKLGWHLYWHKNADNDPANQWLRETLLDITSKQ